MRRASFHADVPHDWIEATQGSVDILTLSSHPARALTDLEKRIAKCIELIIDRLQAFSDSSPLMLKSQASREHINDICAVLAYTALISWIHSTLRGFHGQDINRWK